MRNVVLAAALATAVLVSAAVLTGGHGRVTAAQTSIDVGNLYFCDQSFQSGVCESTISSGDTVVWTVSAGAHTVTECDNTFAACPPAGGFDSGTLTQGQQFERTFSSAGTFYYECVFHPQQMRGMIVVQAAQATPTPTPSATPSPATSAAGAATATPTGSPTPASVPATGGDPQGGSSGLPAELAVMAGTLATFAGILVLWRLRSPGR